MISLRPLRNLFRRERPSSRPTPLWRRGKHRRPERILLVAVFDPRGLQTILENINLLGRLSRFRYELINVIGTPGGPTIPANVDLSRYDGIYIHSTASYNAAVLHDLDRDLDLKIADFPGVKILMKQDEQYRTNKIIDYLVHKRFDVLSTCVAREHAHDVYPKERLPNLRTVHALTGYISESMSRLRYRPVRERPLDIGYRGSLQPFYFGRLSWEKRSIGYVVGERAAARGLRTDISSKWEDRFTGPAWFDFLGRCKATLGVESGASIFDWDGTVEERCVAFQREHPDASFEEVYEAVLAPHDGVTFYNQISPRHFEAAACRTLQILYEGAYSGIFEADRHYLSLRRDHQNLDELLDRALDPAEQDRLTGAAFDEIVASPSFRYETFVASLDDVVEAAFAAN